jgi:hypothetical protein
MADRQNNGTTRGFMSPIVLRFARFGHFRCRGWCPGTPRYGALGPTVLQE